MIQKKFIKLRIIIPVLIGVLLIASLPYFSTKANGENFRNEEEDEITVDKTIHDFGTISESGGDVKATFTITNNSKTPILIQHVFATCGCTTPEWTKEPINPGKTGSIVAIFNPKNRPGPFEKSVAIMTSGNPSRIAVRIKGTVE